MVAAMSSELKTSDDPIALVETVPLSIPFTHGGGRRGVAATGGTWQSLDMLLVRIETVEGRIGWGEAFAYALGTATRHVIDTRLATALIGRTVTEALDGLSSLARSVHAYGRGGIVQFALSGVDIALWDLRAKQQGLPLRELIGGTRDRFPAYASLFRYEDADDVGGVATEAVAKGFRHLKLHEATPSCVEAARSATGPNVLIATDVNCPWDVKAAIAGIGALEPFDLAWVEEPIWPPEDHDGLRTVRSAVPIALAAGENEPNPVGLGHLSSGGAVDIVQPSITKLGGVSAVLEVLRERRPDEARVVPHSFYYGPGLLATLQTASLAPDDVLIEWMFAEPEAHLYGDGIRPDRGTISTPSGDGLGCDPDPEVVRAFRTA